MLQGRSFAVSSSRETSHSGMTSIVDEFRRANRIPAATGTRFRIDDGPAVHRGTADTAGEAKPH
ncbi:MAG TPA: hypothetical protein DCG12_09310 [Planctomycetaceae bacterium]|nr:hypothetical protein [Planctomycetaceae bacterium]